MAPDYTRVLYSSITRDAEQRTSGQALTGGPPYNSADSASTLVSDLPFLARPHGQPGGRCSAVLPGLRPPDTRHAQPVLSTPANDTRGLLCLAAGDVFRAHHHRSGRGVAGFHRPCLSGRWPPPVSDRSLRFLS